MVFVCEDNTISSGKELLASDCMVQCSPSLRLYCGVGCSPSLRLYCEAGYSPCVVCKPPLVTTVCESPQIGTGDDCVSSLTSVGKAMVSSPPPECNEEAIFPAPSKGDEETLAKRELRLDCLAAGLPCVVVFGVPLEEEIGGMTPLVLLESGVANNSLSVRAAALPCLGVVAISLVVPLKLTLLGMFS